MLTRQTPDGRCREMAVSDGVDTDRVLRALRMPPEPWNLSGDASDAVRRVPDTVRRAEE